MNGVNKMKWSDKETKRLKELHAEGLTDCGIAKQLNLEFGNNRSYRSVEHRRRYLLLDGKPVTCSKTEIDVPFIKNNIESFADFIKNNLFKNQSVPYSRRKGKQEEKSVLLMSDIHAGMVNKILDKNSGAEITTYDTKIRQREMITLRNAIIEIKTLLSHSYDLNHLYIFNLGDNITNDRIFNGQVFHIDKCVGAQVIEMARDLSYFINEMKKVYPKITFIGIVGNHGRSTKDSDCDEPVENNYEYLLFKMIEAVFKDDKNVEIIVPTTKFFVYKIHDHKYMLTHGDSIRGFTRNSIERSLKDYLIANDSDFDVLAMGHFHRIDKICLSEKNTAIVNGSWIEKDSYGYRVAHQYSKPQQVFFGVSHLWAITWDFSIDLIRKKVKQ